jgi:hypothetical protein
MWSKNTLPEMAFLDQPEFLRSLRKAISQGTVKDSDSFVNVAVDSGFLLRTSRPPARSSADYRTSGEFTTQQSANQW